MGACPSQSHNRFSPFGKKCGILIASFELCYMCMLDEICAKRDEIYAIARAHKAEKLWVFGSCARKEETPESDVDFLC